MVQEYKTADGGIGKRVLKTFSTQQTTTKTTRYGSDGALRTETTLDSTPYVRKTSPMPARSSSSMSKLTHQIDESCKHGHHHHHQKSNTHPLKMDGNPPAGYSLYHVERREETTRTSSGGSDAAQIPTTPTSSRKVKFQDDEFINRKEFEQACSSLQSSTKDIDILPDPELDTGKFESIFLTQK